MPTDGSGNYSLPDGSIVTTGTTATAASQNTPNNDIAAALTARLMANGAKTWTGNQNAGGYKVTNLAAATTNGDAVRYEQWQLAAGETNRGIIELATTAEAATGTDTTRAVTPAGLPAYADGRAASAANIWAGTADKVVESDNLVSAGAWVTLTDQATIATDCATGRNFTVTINGSRTMGAPTNVKVGMVYTYEIVQGTGGSRTITWNSVFKFGDGTATLSTSEGDKDLVSFIAVTSTRLAFLGIRKGVQ